MQSVYEDVARDTNRGHTVRAVCESFQLAKDSGFKVHIVLFDFVILFTHFVLLQVVAHMMPDLPNVDSERDLQQFVVSFSRHIKKSKIS